VAVVIACKSATRRRPSASTASGRVAPRRRLWWEKPAPSPRLAGDHHRPDLMPPEACAAGLKDVEYSVKKLATANQAATN